MMYLIDDRWINDIEDIFDDRSEIDEHPDGITIVEGVLEPLFQIDQKLFKHFYDKLVDKFDERRSEDGDEWEKVYDLLMKCFDFEKFNAEVPKMYFSEEGREIHYTQAELYAMFD